MCGFFGAIDSRLKKEHLLDACDVLEHRGPDGHGVYLDTDLNVGLAHRRLAIIDLESGDQPLFDRDRNIILVCNGEIYNFENIRSHLAQEGFHFQTHSDAEVILQLYLKYGLELFGHLRGEFAFLLLDKRKKILIACRDRFGIKPLFLANTDTGGWLFASEAKAMFASGLKQAELQFLSNEKHETGTFFRGVFGLPPGTALVVGLSDNSHQVLTYWAPDFPRSDTPAEEKPFSEWKAKTEALLTESIAHRLRADVPVGVYLSGGVDSALLIAKVREITGNPPPAFTVCFPDMPEFDEGSIAERIAEHVGVDHYTLRVETNDLWANLEKCLWHTEGTINDFAPVAKFLLSGLAGKHVKVVLTGEGSDEVFLGYRSFRKRLQNYEQGSPWWLLNGLWTSFRRRAARLAIQKRPRPARCSSPLPAILPEQCKDNSQIDGRHPLIVLQYQWLKTHLLKNILVSYADRTEMAHSVEGRLPFLDHRLFEVARTIPIEYKIHHGREKHIIREIARGLVPEEVLDRRKWPFSTALPSFDQDRYPACAHIWNTYLTQRSIREAGLFRWHVVAVLKFLRRFRILRRSADAQLFHICCMQILHKLFVPAPRQMQRPIREAQLHSVR